MPLCRVKILISCMILLTLGFFSAYADEKPAALNKFLWKNRIVLSYPASEKAWTAQRQATAELQRQVDDRDIVILRLDKPSKFLTQSQCTALIRHYKLSPGNHLLIGKDGTEKSRQSGPLKLDSWFSLIDTMPMRKAEIRSEK